jgi:acyl-CoA dehydrogenase
VTRFAEQAEGLKTLLTTAPPSEEQITDLDFMLTLGELFTLVVYGQLILEEAALTGLPTDTVDQIFDVLVRDFSAYAVALHGRASSTEAQQAWALENIRKPIVDEDRFASVWGKVRDLAGAYEMRA